MSKSAPAPLTMPVIPRKGEAQPAVSSFDGPLPMAEPPSPEILPQTDPAPARLSSRVQATIAVTVRLDERRYERMKTWGTSRRVTNQEMIVAALDQFFCLSDAEREDVIAGVRK